MSSLFRETSRRHAPRAWVMCALAVAALSSACNDENSAGARKAAPVEQPTRVKPLVASGLPVLESLALMRLASDTTKGRAVEFVPWRTPDQVVARISAGQVDFAILAANQPALLAARGLRVRVVRVLSASENIAFLATRKAGTLRQALQGARIVAPFRHGLPALVLSDLLQHFALKPSQDCQLQFVEAPMDALSLLGSGRADAALLAEPVVTAAMDDQRLAGATRWNVDEAWREAHPDLPFAASTLAAVGPINDDPTALSAFVKRFDTALGQLRVESAGSAELANKHFPQLPRDSVSRALTQGRYQVVDPEKQCQVWRRFLEWVAERDISLLGGRLPDASVCVTP